jgi:hypothetical protein
MRFVVTGEWTRNRLLTVIVWLFLMYTFLFWITMGAMYFAKMGLTYESVVKHYLGDEETFRQPHTYQGMLELAHFHMFAMGMLLMTLTHLLLFVPLPPTFKAWLISLSFTGGLINEGAGWLVRFAHPRFAYMKIGGFLLLQSSLLVLMVAAAWSLFTRAPSAYAQPFTPPRQEESP